MCETLSKYLQKIASSIDLVKRYHFGQVLPRRFSVVIPAINSTSMADHSFCVYFLLPR